MKENALVGFIDMKVDDVQKQDLTLRLEVAPQSTLFSYELVQVDAGPVTGVLTEPIQPSKQQSISVEFTCAPKVFANSEQRYYVIRSVAGRDAIDTTLVTVTTAMVPRPVTMRVRAEHDTMAMRIGDTASLRIFLDVEGDIDEPIHIQSVKGRVGYNPTVVVSVLSDNWTRTRDGDRMYVEYTSGQTQDVVVDGPSTVLAEIPIVAVLGDDDKSILDLDGWVFSIASQRVDLNASDALVQLTNVWEFTNGGKRFVNSLQGPLVMDIDPNPVTTTATLSVNNIPAGVGELVVVDVNGSIVADLTSQLRAGTRQFTITKGSGGSVVVGPGSYYARLLVRTSSGDSINSIARLFVVQ